MKNEEKKFVKIELDGEPNSIIDVACKKGENSKGKRKNKYLIELPGAVHLPGEIWAKDTAYRIHFAL